MIGKTPWVRCMAIWCLGALLWPAVLAAGAPPLAFPSYGTGPIEVRVYSDYFCPPCQATEPEMEPLITSLLKRKAIRLTLVDVPYHQHTPLFARYFLAALQEKNEVEHALKVRTHLFEMALNNVTTAERIEALLKARGIPFAQIDPKPLYERYNLLLREDKINATPTVVILREGKREKWIGGEEILKALRALP